MSNDHDDSIYKVTLKDFLVVIVLFSAFQTLRKRAGRTITCFSSPHLRNVSRNSIGSRCFVFQLLDSVLYLVEKN